MNIINTAIANWHLKYVRDNVKRGKGVRLQRSNNNEKGIKTASTSASGKKTNTNGKSLVATHYKSF